MVMVLEDCMGSGSTSAMGSVEGAGQSERE
jgi:hypothetical protein